MCSTYSTHKYKKCVLLIVLTPAAAFFKIIVGSELQYLHIYFSHLSPTKNAVP